MFGIPHFTDSKHILGKVFVTHIFC